MHLDAKSEIYSFYKLSLKSVGLFIWVLDTSWLFLQVLLLIGARVKLKYLNNLQAFSGYLICISSLYSFEMEDLLPYQVDFFLPFFVHTGMSVQICSRVRGSLH